MKGQRDNFRAGLFVLAGLALAMGVVYMLSDLERLAQKRQTIRVFYGLRDGLQGLKVGAIVTLGDQPVGAVTAITQVYDDSGDNHIVGLVVDCAIPARVKLYWDAQIELVVPPLGSGTKLNIRSVGGQPRGEDQPIAPVYQRGGAIPDFVIPSWATRRGPSADQPIAYLGPSDAIPGYVATSSLVQNLTENMGISDLQRQQIRNIISNVEQVTLTVNRRMPALVDKVDKVLDDADSGLGKAGTALDSAQASLDSVKEIIGTVKDRVQNWADQIDVTLQNVRQFTTAANETLAEARPKLNETLDNARSLTGKLDEAGEQVRSKLVQQVSDAVREAQAALESMRTTAERLRDLVTAERPVIDRAIANVQIMTDQLKLAAVEIRRSPWRLLYAPPKEELDTDNLYDAARSFALAAGALDSASRSIEAVLADQRADSADVKQMLDHLKALFGRFKEAEDAFWKQLEGRLKAAEK